LSSEKEVRRIIVFGSFLEAPDPHDVDVAVIEDSEEAYLPLAMKYRRLTREIARQIPLDIFPVRADAPRGSFISELERGEVIYEG